MLLPAALTLMLKRHPIPDKAQGKGRWMDQIVFSAHSASVQDPRGNSNFRGSFFLDDCLSLTLTRAPVIAELPTHLLLAVAAKQLTDLWQSNEAAVHLWSCRSLWKIFRFQTFGPESKQLVP